MEKLLASSSSRPRRSPLLGVVEGANHDEIRIRYRTNIAGFQGNESIGPTGSRYELDFKAVGCIGLNHGAKIPGAKSMLAEVPNQNDRVGRFVAHGFIGYTVTSRGVSPSPNAIQTAIRTPLTLFLFGNQLADGRNQFDRDDHPRVRSVSPSSFVFGYRFLIRLGLVELENESDSIFAPTRWISGLTHFLVENLRSKTGIALGQSSYAVLFIRILRKRKTLQVATWRGPADP